MATTPDRLLVTGAAGYLGRELAAQAAAAGVEVTGTWHDRPADGIRLDIRDAGAVRRVVSAVTPDAVVHTAYLQSGDAMRAVNVEGSANVAAAAAATAARMVHLSTDFVFDGEQAAPYGEHDRPAPVTAYGQAKLDAERAVADAYPAALIVRTSLIYGGAEPGPHEQLVLDVRQSHRACLVFAPALEAPQRDPECQQVLEVQPGWLIQGATSITDSRPSERTDITRSQGRWRP